MTSSPGFLPSGREYVVARLVEQTGAWSVPVATAHGRRRGLSGDPAAILPSVLWGLLLVAGLAAMVGAYLRWPNRRWTVYLLSTPIALSLALVWYENLIRLLPATM